MTSSVATSLATVDRVGRRYSIVKVYWQLRALQGRLDALGWDVQVRETAQGLCVLGDGARKAATR